MVKLFGGARVLDVSNSGSSGRTVGEQNVARALEILEVLGLMVRSADTDGVVGRKLFSAPGTAMCIFGG